MSARSRLAIAMLVVLTLLPGGLEAQRRGGAPPAPPINPSADPLLRGLRWRVIGPIQQGGRVNDVAVVESDPSVYYVGFATAGLWKTSNNGTTFEPIFDTFGTHSVGDIAIAPSNPDVLYIGTGEPNNRQSSSFGEGVYKSTDGGRTFTHSGLRETQTIARIVVHPTNPDVVWVAANGHLFGPNPERGVFKSTDGGRTWTKVLFVNDDTGATDIVLDPSNPDVLIAAMYQRRRTSWGFVGGGPGSGIHRTEDGGRTWTRVSGNGLPNGTMGRIGLSMSRSNPNVVFAQIEVGPDREPAQAQPAGGGRRGGGGGGGGGGQNQPPDPQRSGVWRSADKGRTWEFRSNQNNRPMYYSQIRVDPNDENVLYVGGSGASKSTDGGRTWTQLSGLGHVDHHTIWIDPSNSEHVIYGNDGSLDVSYDGGENWTSLRTWEAGQSYHASVDMRRPYYVCTGLQDNGSWCGPSSVRSGAILPQDWYRVGGGDGFYSQVDPTDHTVVYAESQNGNMRRLDLRNGTSKSVRPSPPEAPGQGGRGGGAGDQDPGNIVPPPPASCSQGNTENCTDLRWNWNTPIVLSPHDPRTVYTGANHFFVSHDRGETWSMSPDLTKGISPASRSIMGISGELPSCGAARVGACINSRNDGVSDWGTIITISESRATPGVLWVGTDDGNIQVSRDHGATWTEVGVNVPGGTREYYVSRVEASHFDPATAYVSLDGHRNDDLRPYIYVTRDYGRTWTSIASDLPAWGNVNTVRQDPRNRNLLYAGTEFGFFVSLDEGQSWKKLMTNLAVVRVDDVLVHPRDNDLVLATHGRSIQIMDDISPLQQLTPEVLASDAHVFQPRSTVLWNSDTRLARAVTGNHNFDRGENAPPGTAISYYLRTVPSGDVRIVITGPDGEPFRNLTGPKQQGINRIQWNLRGDPEQPQAGQQGGGGGGGGGGGQRGGGGGNQGPLAEPGVYRLTVTIGGRQFVRSILVEEDVWMDQR
jgi:photosystem II stability/assembly factor-like uncharacterized protein